MDTKFQEIRKLIKECANNKNKSFEENVNILEEEVKKLEINELKDVLVDVGIIPEDIQHDSTEEKLFSKLTDLILARVFNFLELKAEIVKKRSNCADVIAKSEFHKYTLVADAKSFRLSRTAKNQKDFKVKSMVDWRGDNDFAIVVSPYYQYPKINSQIYGQALDGNICLLSWEHLLFFLEKNLKETEKVNLSYIWGLSGILASKVVINDKNKYENFHKTGNELICKKFKLKIEELNKILKVSKTKIKQKGSEAIEYWEKKIKDIKSYSKEKAIDELINALKINEKIKSIKNYLSFLGD